ncbi:MAG TPA: TetR/AcrR family transcriptional regulator [Stellaceae bacterium]|nr:TetR/AcrR family transcriptional regulator [Stellaceae bacterium]
MRAIGVKEKVEQAALALFAARGVDGVSIADIASAAGVAQGALYRHYRSKDELALSLFSTAYRQVGAELQEIVLREPKFAARIRAMIAHFCALYDSDAALFRFLLLAQHSLLEDVPDGDGSAPVAAVEKAVTDAVACGEIGRVDVTTAAAAIMGIVLQTALFHVYGRITGPLTPRAPALADAALAAVAALADQP